MSSLEQMSKGARMLSTLRKGRRHTRECGFPGMEELRLVVVPLFVDELQQAHAEAEERFRELGIEVTLLTADDFTSELHLQILSRALRDPEDSELRTPMFRGASELRSNSTADERTLLVDEYVEVQAAANPAQDSMSDEVFEQIQDAIKKKDQTQLSSIGSRMLSLYLLSTGNPP